MTLTRAELAEVAEALGALPTPAAVQAHRPRYNVAPSQPHPVVWLSDGRRRLGTAVWGFPRPTAPGRAPAGLIINARSETVPFRSMFRDAFIKHRCLVPADGFYEWRSDGARRQPLWFHARDGGLLCFAGLYLPPPAGEEGRFVVLTTAPNELVAQVHDRMPAVLTPDEAAAWLERPDTRVLHPAPEGCLVATPVSMRVNAVANDDPACLAPPAEGQAPDRPGQLRLF